MTRDVLGSYLYFPIEAHRRMRRTCQTHEAHRRMRRLWSATTGQVPHPCRRVDACVGATLAASACAWRERRFWVCAQTEKRLWAVPHPWTFPRSPTKFRICHTSLRCPIFISVFMEVAASRRSRRGARARWWVLVLSAASNTVEGASERRADARAASSAGQGGRRTGEGVVAAARRAWPWVKAKKGARSQS